MKSPYVEAGFSLIILQIIPNCLFICFFIRFFICFFIRFFICYIFHYKKRRTEVKLEVRLSIPVGAKFILDRLNTSAISVHEPKYLHAFSYNAVAVIVDIGKVFGRGFAIESSGIRI